MDPRERSRGSRDRYRRARRPARGVLSAAVPSHPRERCGLGQGLHGMDQRHPGEAALPGSPSAASARRARLLRPSPARGDGTAGGAGARTRHLRLLPLFLLVRWTSAAGAAPGGDARLGPPGHALLPVLGERELDPEMGWRRIRGHCRPVVHARVLRAAGRRPPALPEGQTLSAGRRQAHAADLSTRPSARLPRGDIRHPQILCRARHRYLHRGLFDLLLCGRGQRRI